jgi:hypothetical protein
MASTNSLTLTKRLADAYFTGTFKMLLVSSLPSEADFDAFDFRNDIANEVGASGSYPTGGAAVTCTVGAIDTTNNRVPVTFGNPATFTAATISAVGGWIYKSIGTAATDELVTFIDFGGTVSSTASTFAVTVSAPLYINR